MEKIFENGDQVHVAQVILYPGTGADAGKYFEDSAKTVEVEAAKIFQLFAKGILVDNGTTLVKPVACTRAGVLTLPTIS